MGDLPRKNDGLIMMGDLPKEKMMEDGLIVMNDLPRRNDGLIMMSDLPRKKMVVLLWWATYLNERWKVVSL